MRGSELVLSALALWKTYWPDARPEKSDPDDFRARFETELGDIEDEFYGLEDKIVAQLSRIVNLLQKGEN